jgi:predicted metal-dependent hydrolase
VKIKTVQLQNTSITYKVRKNSLARNIRISINREGEVALTVPRFVPERFAENFLISKADWIISQVNKINDAKPFKNLLKYPPYKTSRKEAHQILKKKVEEVNEFYNFKYGRITIKNQRTCWGSCSRRGNLNFNYKLAFMDDKYADYVVTHELCHLKELNHSKRFWTLVAERLPNYKIVQKEMRQRGFHLD